MEAGDPLTLMSRRWLQLSPVSAEAGADPQAEMKAVPEELERHPLLQRQLAGLAEGGAAEAEAHSSQNLATQLSWLLVGLSMFCGKNLLPVGGSFPSDKSDRIRYPPLINENVWSY